MNFKLSAIIGLLFLVESGWCGNLVKNGDFAHRLANWRKPHYYSGQLTYLPKQGADPARARLTAQGAGDKAYGRFFQLVRLNGIEKRKLHFQVQAQGQGVLHLGYLKYVQNPGAKLKVDLVYLPNTLNLHHKVQTLENSLLLNEVNVFMIAPFVELRGAGAQAEIFSIKLLENSAAGTLKFARAHEIVPGNAPFPALQAQYLTAGETPQPKVKIEWQSSTGRGGFKVTDQTGKIHFAPRELTSDMQKLLVVEPNSGTARELYFDRMPAAQFDKFAQLAAQFPRTKPCRILMLGDSLSDFKRGHNYLDKTAFFLNRERPGSFTFRNAGVGGDYITRVVRRLECLESGRSTYRQAMYHNLWQDKYDYIFIFLGQNDNRTSSRDNYQKPVVSPQAQARAYRRAITLIRQHSRAKIVLFSSSMPDVQRIAQLQKKAEQKKRPFVRFGEEKRQKQFNAIVQKIGAELPCDYLDLYGALQQVPARERATFFEPSDGVHLTEIGNRFVAGVLLKYLVNK